MKKTNRRILKFTFLIGVLISLIYAGSLKYSISFDGGVHKNELIIRRNNLKILTSAQSGNFVDWAQIDLDKDPKLIDTLKKAASEQDPIAQLYLGNSYEHGIGVEKDYAKAAENYLFASLHPDKIDVLVGPKDKQVSGLQLVQFNLANFYRHGLGLPQNIERAVELYRRVAGTNITHDIQIAACQALGNIYYYGKDNVKPNLVKSLHYYKLAAEKGNTQAQSHLGFLYLTGKGGLPKNLKRAFELTKLAAEKKHPDALNNLASMYFEGLGVKKDQKKGIQLLKQAADAGNELAKRNLEKLKKQGIMSESNYSNERPMKSMIITTGNNVNTRM